MLWRCSELRGYEIAATDGTVGLVDDLLFDEARWALRWAVADTGGWLSPAASCCCRHRPWAIPTPARAALRSGASTKRRFTVTTVARAIGAASRIVMPSRRE